MISGFICEINYIKNSNTNFKDFIKHKIMRLYPITTLSILFLLVVEGINFILTGSAISKDGLGIWKIANSITLLFGIGITKINGLGINYPLWYLEVLILCYVVFFITKKVSVKYKNIKNWHVYLCIIILSQFFKNNPVTLPFINSQTCRGLLTFFIGVVLYYIYIKVSAKKVIKVSLFICVVIVFSYFFNRIILIDNEYYICAFLFFPSLILLLVELGDKKNFDTKLLGSLSFEIYVWHAPLLKVLKLAYNIGKINYCNNSLLWMICFTCVVIIFALFIVLFVEKKAYSFANMLIDKKVVTLSK